VHSNDAEVPTIRLHQIVEWPQRRNRPEFDVGVDVRGKQVTDRFDLDRLDRFMADPLAGRSGPVAEQFTIEGVAKQLDGPDSVEPAEFDCVHPPSGGVEGRREQLAVGVVSGPRRHPPALPGEPVERCMLGIELSHQARHGVTVGGGGSLGGRAAVAAIFVPRVNRGMTYHTSAITRSCAVS
jgi:hypothetical protein